jgi:hypothetical protein
VIELAVVREEVLHRREIELGPQPIQQPRSYIADTDESESRADTARPEFWGTDNLSDWIWGGLPRSITGEIPPVVRSTSYSGSNALFHFHFVHNVPQRRHRSSIRRNRSSIRRKCCGL